VIVNLRGRERYGIVPAGELASIKAALATRFEQLTGPDDKPVTDVVYAAEDVFHGDALEGAPDLMPVLRDHRYELDDEVFHRHPFTDLSHLPRGVHHPDGIVVVAGPATTRKSLIEGSVLDVTPTVLYLAGLRVPQGLDGEVLVSAFEERGLEDHPVQRMPALSSKGRDETSPYSEEEETLIEESLRGLGYL
jgi:predicted AlkP superfamily phosphohydrolase/phosphomutase